MAQCVSDLHSGVILGARRELTSLPLLAVLAPAIDSSGLAQPMVFDATGDMSIDLFGYKLGETAVPILWENVWAKSEQSSLFNLSVLRCPRASGAR